MGKRGGKMLRRKKEARRKGKVNYEEKEKETYEKSN